MIGFPPKLVKFQWGETEYALGSIPLGGAVQIAGMVDESLEDSDTWASTDPKPWEFRSKPAWQRLIVLLGGILFNLLSAAVLYIVFAYVLGHSYLSKEEVNKYGIVPSEIGMQMGFQEGDKLIRINGKDFDDFFDFISLRLLLGAENYYTVERSGTMLDIPIPEGIMERLTAQKRPVPFLQPAYPYKVGAVEPNSKAATAGLMAGDQLLKIEEHPVLYVHQLKKALKMYQGMKATITYLRQGITQTTCIQLNTQKELLGLQLKTTLTPSHIRYSLPESILAGTKETLRGMQEYLLGIWKLITGKLSVKKSLGGPISIAQAFGSEFVWWAFWKQVANFSIVIALTNLLPLPALDGGHALFVIYEMVSGRKPSDRFLAISQKLGMVVLLALMLYAFGNDIRKLFGSF
jgi:regulator of sigma E protease